jgi:hypothetical protein
MWDQYQNVLADRNESLDGDNYSEDDEDENFGSNEIDDEL